MRIRRSLPALVVGLLLASQWLAAPRPAEALFGNPCLGFKICVDVKVGTEVGGYDGSGTVTGSDDLNCRFVHDAIDPTSTCEVWVRSLTASSVSVGWEAAADPHDQVNCWSGDALFGAACGESTLYSANQTVLVNVDFRKVPYDLSVTKTSPDGATGTISSNAGIFCGLTCDNPLVPYGTVVSLTATPASGALFAGWDKAGACAGQGPTCQFTQTSNVAVSASFAFSRHLHIDVRASITEGGTYSGHVTSTPAGISCGLACDADFPDGSTVTLKEVPDPGSVFLGWQGTDACDPRATTCAILMTFNDVVIAAFWPANVPLPGSTLPPIPTPKSTVRPTAAPGATTSPGSTAGPGPTGGAPTGLSGSFAPATPGLSAGSSAALGSFVPGAAAAATAVDGPSGAAEGSPAGPVAASSDEPGGSTFAPFLLLAAALLVVLAAALLARRARRRSGSG